ncbi:MAG TPA: pectin acetylesterase-family hydrolase, partial [Myxococcota bacterium]|nr:pectin acetylesterase-family hydrolase [Myxococcota bacterium]
MADALSKQLPDPESILTPRPSATAPAVSPGAGGDAAQIRAEDREWTWVPTVGAVCGDGSPTGFAVSLVADSPQLLVFFEGGGACGDARTCYAVRSAVHVVDGYTQETFDEDLQEKAAVQAYWPLTNRVHEANPFRDASLAYIPYCTGDLHDGDNVVTYEGAPQQTHHVGYRNTRLYLQALAATLPTASRVVLSGFSAGGFAAALHRDTAATAFPRARIDVIDDSGVAFKDAPNHDVWKAHLPADCAACA